MLPQLSYLTVSFASPHSVECRFIGSGWLPSWILPLRLDLSSGSRFGYLSCPPGWKQEQKWKWNRLN